MTTGTSVGAQFHHVLLTPTINTQDNFYFAMLRFSSSLFLFADNFCFSFYFILKEFFSFVLVLVFVH